MVTAEPLTPTTTTAQPMAPNTLEEAGLSSDLILQLALKTLHFSGQLSGTDLAGKLKLKFPVIEPVLETLVQQRYLAIVDGGVIGRASYTYRISDAGRERAQLFLENNHYVTTSVRRPCPSSSIRTT